MAYGHSQIWNNCLRIISDNISATSFRTWFKPIKPVKLENNILTIEVPSHFFYEYIEENFVDLLSKVLRKEIGKGAQLEYSVVVSTTTNNGKMNVPSIKHANTNNKAVSDKREEIRNPFIVPTVKKVTINSNLQDRWNFQNFIVGDCNRVASEVGHAISEKPGKTPFNPLFIYSNRPGLGKTHISHAIGLEAKKLYPETTVLYLSADKFATQYAEATRKNNRNDFIHFYQMIDVLIIDDIQELTKKEKTQQVFFHIFNHLHQSSKQLILTSDRPPIELEGMEDRLLNRFKWGLSTELTLPDFEVRKQVFKHKAKQEGIVIRDEVIDYVCKHVKTSIRELEGVLVSILAYSTIGNEEINLELVEKLVNQTVKNTKKEVHIPYIKKKVSDYFSLSEEDLLRKSRCSNIVQARQIAMYFSREITKSSLASIGSQIGNKNHATVLHACKTVENLMETNKKYRYQIEEIRTLLQE